MTLIKNPFWPGNETVPQAKIDEIEIRFLDASPALIDIARRRTPDADLRVGDLQFLPFEDDDFDLVCGFNAFFFAADMTAALREAGRVAKPGAPVVIQVWGHPDRCDLTAMRKALAPFYPSPPPGAATPPVLSEPGVLEAIAREAGLTPAETFDGPQAEYPSGAGRQVGAGTGGLY